jgi:hypothetical protein
MAHDIGVHVEPVPHDCLHAPTSSSAFAHGMPAFPALPARRRTRSRCTQTGTGRHPPGRCWLIPAMRGVCIRLSRAAFRIPNPGERFPAGRGSGRARPRSSSALTPAPNSSLVDRLLVSLNWAGIQEIPEQADGPGPQGGPSRLTVQNPAVPAPQTCQIAPGPARFGLGEPANDHPGHAARSSATCGPTLGRQAGQPGFHDPTTEP